MIRVSITLVFLMFASVCFADYSIDWYTIDGGGGRSTGGPLCFVEFEDFARFAEYWLETGTGLPADLYEDDHNIVDRLDLKVFVDQWLCYCPADWPLK